MDQIQWQHLMTVDLKVLKEKYNNSSKKMSFLFFCLKGGYLIEEKYLKWAQSTYELPKVNSKFFEENNPKMDLWKKWKDLYAWSEACIPLGEWDDHLLIGTLEPLPEIQKKAKVQFILCKSADLADWWKIYHPTSLEKASEQAQGQGAKGLFLLDHWKKSNTKVILEMSQFVFAQMKSLFDKSMVLSINENLNLLRPFTWDEGFKEHSKNLRIIPLNTPSLFNIVASTQKTFHGNVTPNEINDIFFEDWNKGQTPEHATLSPILINDQIVGMILGIGSKNLYNKQTLKKVESIAMEVGKRLEQNHKATQAAA